MLKVQLTRDLRKSVLRGHPWLYQEAVQIKGQSDIATLCQVLDKKGKPLAWGIFSPRGPLTVRILSTDSKPPNQTLYASRLHEAWGLRQSLLSEATTALRIVNGEGDRLPGLVCDLYGSVAVLQFDGDSCYEFWDQEFLADWFLKNTPVQTVYCKPRRSDDRKGEIWGEALVEDMVEIKENGIRFLVDIVNGQKTGFFLDQRDNRQYLKGIAKGKKVLNLFSYTGGFSLYAGLGGAQAVLSVDLSAPALEMAQKSWQLNGFEPDQHKILAVDVFDFLENHPEEYQIVMVDPPSMSHSEKTKQQAIRAYTDLFAKAARLVEKGHHLVLSSCSSHITFEDFYLIIDEALSLARRSGRILRISGQGMDHPFPHACHELRYLKFVDLVID